eukprot:776829-Prymnesium_polylepis.1
MVAESGEHEVVYEDGVVRWEALARQCVRTRTTYCSMRLQCHALAYNTLLAKQITFSVSLPRFSQTCTVRSRPLPPQTDPPARSLSLSCLLQRARARGAACCSIHAEIAARSHPPSADAIGRAIVIRILFVGSGVSQPSARSVCR